MRNRIGTIVLWGSLWGITEATLGYFLHMLPVNIGWIVWFPVAFFFLSIVYKKTGNSESMIFSAAITAVIKFVDVMLPGTIDRVVNPSVSILLEAFTVYLLYKVILGAKFSAITKYTGAFATSLLWRIFYAGYILLLPAWMFKISPVANSDAFISFLLLEGAVNGICVAALVWVLNGKRLGIDGGVINGENSLRIMKVSFPYLLLLIAIVVQILI